LFLNLKAKASARATAVAKTQIDGLKSNDEIVLFGDDEEEDEDEDEE